MIDKLNIIDLIFVNIIFWVIFFFPLFSIIDYKKKSLEEVKRIVQRKYLGIRFLITMYLLLMLVFLIYLMMLSTTVHDISRAIIIAFGGVALLRIMTFHSKDYEN